VIVETISLVLFQFFCYGLTSHTTAVSHIDPPTGIGILVLKLLAGVDYFLSKGTRLLYYKDSAKDYCGNILRVPFVHAYQILKNQSQDMKEFVCARSCRALLRIQ